MSLCQGPCRCQGQACSPLTTRRRIRAGGHVPAVTQLVWQSCRRLPHLLSRENPPFSCRGEEPPASVQNLQGSPLLPIKAMHFRGTPLLAGTEQGCTRAWLFLSAPELPAEWAETGLCLQVVLRLSCPLLPLHVAPSKPLLLPTPRVCCPEDGTGTGRRAHRSGALITPIDPSQPLQPPLSPEGKGQAGTGVL